MTEYYETIKLKNGFTARIWQDIDADNPWAEWDGQPPMVTLLRYSRDDKDNLIRRSIENLDIAQLTELFDAELIARMREDTDDDGELLNECQDYLRDQSRFDQLDYAERAYGMRGIKTERFSTQECDGMLVATQAWMDEVGIDAVNVQASLVKDVKLYRARWEGNVWGYTIYRPDGTSTDSACGGFYGNNEDSGILEDINSSLECEISLLAGDLEQWKAELVELNESHISGEALLDLVSNRITELAKLISANTESEGE